MDIQQNKNVGIDLLFLKKKQWTTAAFILHKGIVVFYSDWKSDVGRCKSVIDQLPPEAAFNLVAICARKGACQMLWQTPEMPTCESVYDYIQDEWSIEHCFCLPEHFQFHMNI